MASPILKFKRGNFSNLPGLQAGEPAFTVDKFDLYVGIDSTTSNNKFIGSNRFWTQETSTAGSGVNLVEGSNNGSNHITLKAPATIGSNQTYVFPASPVSGGFLRSDGSSGLSWDTGSGFNNGSIPALAIDIDGATASSTVADSDLFVFDDGANGTNRKITATNMKDYFLGGGAGANFNSINVSGVTTAGQLDATTLKVAGISTFTGQVFGDVQGDFTSTKPLRNQSGGGLIAGVGAIKNTGSAGLVTAFKFTGGGIDSYTVSNGVAHVATTGVAATTFTTSQTTVATQGQTAFTVSAGYTDGFVEVYQNGVRLITGTDYTETDANTITLASGATVGDEIETVAWKSLGDVVNINSVNVVENLQVTGITTSGGVTLSSGAFTGSGSGLTAGTVPLSSLDIDGGTATTTLADADLFIVDDGAGGTNRKVTFETLSDAVLGGGTGANFAAVNVTGITTVGGIIDANGGANISGGAGLVASTAKISDLTDNRVVIAGTSGELEDSGNLTFNGSTLAVTGNITANNGATITGAETTLSSATVSDLTDNRVVLAGASGALEDSNNLQFDGSTLAVVGSITASQNVTITGNLTVNGTTTQLNTTNSTIEDTLLELQKVDGGALSSDTDKDVGLVLNYYSGSAKKAAFYWDDSAAKFVVSAVATESSGVLTNSTAGSLEMGALFINDCAGNSQVISCSGTTRSLENISVDGGTF